MGWFNRSDASFFASCEEEEETEITARPSICATDGPGMALGSVPPLIIACFLFFLIYPKRLKRRTGWTASKILAPGTIEGKLFAPGLGEPRKDENN